MIPLAILVPVLRRPQNVRPLLESVAETAPGVSVRVLFIADPNDRRELDEIHYAKGLDWPMVVSVIKPGGTYPKKINAGIRETTEGLLFLGADDIRFRPGWREAAEAHLHPAEVVGVNDLLARPHRPDHATHFLVTRSYAAQGTIDGQPGLLSEAYEHNFVDDELIATAERRGVYAYAEDAQIDHLHPMAGARMDDVYDKGYKAMRRDRRRFQTRRKMWMSR